MGERTTARLDGLRRAERSSEPTQYASHLAWNRDQHNAHNEPENSHHPYMNTPSAQSFELRS